MQLFSLVVDPKSKLNLENGLYSMSHQIMDYSSDQQEARQTSNTVPHYIDHKESASQNLQRRCTKPPDKINLTQLILTE